MQDEPLGDEPAEQPLDDPMLQVKVNDFVKQYAQSDIADLPLYAAGFLTEGSTLPAEGDAAEGIYSVLNYAADLDNEANRTFVADWMAEHKAAPTTYAMASYDAASVLDKAITQLTKDGDKVTPENINDAIGKLGQISREVGLAEAIPLADSLLKGEVRGRIVVDVNR